MVEDIESLLRLYDYSPTLVLFENLVDSNLIKEEETLFEISQLGDKEKLNPIDVVLESLLNIISEDISYKQLTHSREKVLINSNVRKLAVERIWKAIGRDKMKLKELHKEWLHMLAEFLTQLSRREKDMKIDKAIFLVSERFRISASSAIKAMVSINSRI
jgi:hypothetical protein